MKKIINGKKYDTETATKQAIWGERNDFMHYDYIGTERLAFDSLAKEVDGINELRELGLFGLKALAKEERKSKLNSLNHYMFSNIIDMAIWLYINIIKPVNSNPKFVETLVNEFLGYSCGDIPHKRQVIPLHCDGIITGFQVILEDEPGEPWVQGPWEYIDSTKSYRY